MNGVTVQIPKDMHPAYSHKYETLAVVVNRRMDDPLDPADVVAYARELKAIVREGDTEKFVVLFTTIPTETGHTPVEASKYTEQAIHNLASKAVARA